MSKALLGLRDLRVELGGNPILRGVTADVARGQITALIGLNGSGKTTLLRAVLKEVPYRGGIDFFCGHVSSTIIRIVPTPMMRSSRFCCTSARTACAKSSGFSAGYS